MATLATLVTRGYGSFGSIAEVVTRGYTANAAQVQADTTGAGGFTAEEIAAFKARQRRLIARQDALRASKDFRLLEALAQQIRALQTLPSLPDEPDLEEALEEIAEIGMAETQRIHVPVAGAVPTPAASAPFEAQEAPELDDLRSEIAELRTIIARLAEARAEADDIEALLLLAA